MQCVLLFLGTVAKNAYAQAEKNIRGSVTSEPKTQRRKIFGSFDCARGIFFNTKSAGFSCGSGFEWTSLFNYWVLFLGNMMVLSYVIWTRSAGSSSPTPTPEPSAYKRKTICGIYFEIVKIIKIRVCDTNLCRIRISLGGRSLPFLLYFFSFSFTSSL